MCFTGWGRCLEKVVSLRFSNNTIPFCESLREMAVYKPPFKSYAFLCVKNDDVSFVMLKDEILVFLVVMMTPPQEVNKKKTTWNILFESKASLFLLPIEWYTRRNWSYHEIINYIYHSQRVNKIKQTFIRNNITSPQSIIKSMKHRLLKP